MNPERPHRATRTATVLRTEQLTRDLVRVHFSGPDLATMAPLEETDSYIKILFPDPGAGASTTGPRPVMRTYTIRHLDPARQAMAVDFVVHGDEGIAGPWARRARPGEQITFRGPGGGWHPSPAAHHLFVGDESAAPAIAAGLDALDDEATATVLLEVADEACHPPLRLRSGIDVQWIHRDGAPAGVLLAQRAEGFTLPDGEVHAFVHGSAEAVRSWRRRLLAELGLPRERTSISGYWRAGQDEDAWQATKAEFVARMEAEQDRPD